MEKIEFPGFVVGKKNTNYNTDFHSDINSLLFFNSY